MAWLGYYVLKNLSCADITLAAQLCFCSLMHSTSKWMGCVGKTNCAENYMTKLADAKFPFETQLDYNNLTVSQNIPHSAPFKVKVWLGGF